MAGNGDLSWIKRTRLRKALSGNNYLFSSFPLWWEHYFNNYIIGGSAVVLTNFVIGFFTGLSAGATVIISQFYGAKNLKQLSKGLHTAYAFSITVSLLISVIGWFATPALLHLLKTPTDVIPDSILYLRIYFLGMIFTLTYNMRSSSCALSATPDDRLFIS